MLQPGVLYARTTESSVYFFTEIITVLVIAMAGVGIVALNDVFVRLGMLRYLSPKMNHVLTIVVHLDGRLLLV